MNLSETESGGRRRHLLAMALEALIADDGSPCVDAVVTAPFGASGILHGSRGREGWVIVDHGGSDPVGLLGAVMVWAIRSEVDALRIIADVESPGLARRAAQFDLEVSAWVRQGRTLTPMRPEPLPQARPADPRHLACAEQITAAGARLTIEHGVVTGEVRGLEICRVVDDSAGAAQLEVGVGANDRLAFSMLYHGEPVEESLRRVVGEVTAHRRPGAPRHPLNQLAPERYLRWLLEQEPELIGAIRVEPAPGPVPRRGLMETTPCVAVGEDAEGRPLLVVCSVGIDLDLIPYAIDARLAQAGIELFNRGGAQPSRLVIAVPSRDLIALQRDVAARIRPLDQWSSAEFVGIDWSGF